MKILGIALIVLGLIGFIFGGITYTTEEQVLDVGPIEVEAQNEETIPITPIASAIAVIAGIGLIYAGRKS